MKTSFGIMTNLPKYFLGAALLTVFLSPVGVIAGDSACYNLQQCREMALNNGMSARAQEQTRLAAQYNRQAALAAMFPHISANAAYMWNNANVHLLPANADFSMGSAAVAPDGTASWTWKDLPATDITNDAGQFIADGYKMLYDKLSPDLRQIFVAQVGITQPVWAGGRLLQAYKIAEATENIADLKLEANRDDIVFGVDEAYWRVVTVGKKRELAEQYYSLLCQLENDVRQAVSEGVATQADLLKVITKRGEAEVNKLQAGNGMTLANMALAQLCGLPLNTAFVLDETGLNETLMPADTTNMQTVVNNRKELRLMEQTEQIAHANTMLAAAGLQPNVVASAGYVYTNPNVDNGFSNRWDSKGFFTAGVVVNIPIAHADDILRYKAAKHAAKAVELKTEETRELLTLQTTQANQKLAEAQQKIVLARLTRNNAEEVLRMAQQAFQEGMITATELMQAQTAWLAAETDLVDAEAEAKTTETQLRKYLGQL